eukprot:403334748
MGLCCSTQIVGQDLENPRKNLANYYPEAMFKQDTLNQSRQLRFLEEELLLGTRNDGWACDGQTALKEGCGSGCGQKFNSYMIKGYFSQEADIVFCYKCIEKVGEPSNLKEHWQGYYQEDKKKTSMKLQCLLFLKRHVRGYGADKVGEYTISGGIDQITGDISIKKNYQGKHNVLVLYRGRMNEELNKITGKWSLESDKKVTGDFKFSLTPFIKYSRPFDKINLNEHDIKVTNHKCNLSGPIARDSGWACDSMSNFATKCLGGITEFYQTTGVQEYRCEVCGFDSCLDCTKYCVWADQVLAANQGQTWTGHYESDGTKTEMKFTQLAIAEGLVIGYGSDEVGEFVINGFQKGDKIRFVKKYDGKHTVMYKGTIDQNNVVRGFWDIQGTQGKFELKSNPI